MARFGGCPVCLAGDMFAEKPTVRRIQDLAKSDEEEVDSN